MFQKSRGPEVDCEGQRWGRWLAIGNYVGKQQTPGISSEKAWTIEWKGGPTDPQNFLSCGGSAKFSTTISRNLYSSKFDISFCQKSFLGRHLREL